MHPTIGAHAIPVNYYFAGSPYTLPPVSTRPVPEGIQELLVQRLRAIPNGEITATANRAGLPLTVLLRLKRGENTDVKLSTLEKLARGLELAPSAVIARPGDKAHVPPRSVHVRVDQNAVRRLVKALRVASEAGQQIVASLAGDDDE